MNSTTQRPTRVEEALRQAIAACPRIDANSALERSPIIYFPWHADDECTLQTIARHLNLPLLVGRANIAEPGGFRSMLAVVGEKSTSVEIHHYNFDGGFHQTEGSDPRELSFQRVDRNTIEQDTRRNGAITVHRRIELSRDGRRMTVTANGTTGGGQKYTNDIRVYEKK